MIKENFKHPTTWEFIREMLCCKRASVASIVLRATNITKWCNIWYTHYHRCMYGEPETEVKELEP